MGDSIFEFGEKFGLEGPFDDWLPKRPATPDKDVAKTSIEFLNESQTYAIQTEVLLRFKLKGETGIFNDPAYRVTISTSNSKLKLSTKTWIGENDYLLYTLASMEVPAKVFLSMEIDGKPKGRFEIEFVKSKDVFTTQQANKLTEEFSFMSPFTRMDDAEAPDEYVGNYCMQGADRALGKLLENSTDFYTVKTDSTHKVINSVNFSGLNTYSRAEQFARKGFIVKNYNIIVESKDWNVNNDMIAKIYAQSTYEEAKKYARSVLYEIAWMQESRGISLLEELIQTVNEKEPGWHIYYLSIVDGFHTQVLAINNTDRALPTYIIWEDHGTSSSQGVLGDIVLGFNRQTSAYFASSCLNRYSNNKKDAWDKQKMQLWKIGTN